MASGGQQTQYAQPANYNISPGTRADGQSSALEVDSHGNLKTTLIDPNNNPVSPNPLNLKPYDYVARAYDANVTETWTFYSGGAGGTLTNTIVIVYTDTSLNTILNVTKT